MKKWILCAVPILGVFLWYASGQNIATFAMLGLVLACPLGHMFLMKHDGHGKHKNHSDTHKT